MRILAVSGSLQARSSNGALLHGLVAEFGDATGGTTATFTRAVHDLPPFNIDTDVEPAIAAVQGWRAELAQADVVLFATPEYAFGIAGSLKNAVMSADVVGVQSVPFARAKVNADGDVTDQATHELLRGLARATQDRISALTAGGDGGG
jgi:chromate reductase